MIRDRLIVGIRNEVLSKRLQMESNLTLEKAKNLIRQREAVQQQQSILKNSKSLEAISKTKSRVGRRQKRVVPLSQPMTRQSLPNQPVQNSKICRRCGKSSHPRQLYPAKDVTCFRCNRKDHYSMQCLSKTVNCRNY